MTAPLRAEWLKLTTTRPFRGLLLGAAGAGVLAAFIGSAQGPPPWDVAQPLALGTAWTMGTLMVTILAVVVGSRTVTEDFSHDTIVHTFVADPGRRRSMMAKAAVAALAAMAVAVVGAVAITATTYAMAVITGGHVMAFTTDATAGAGLVAAAGLMGVIGAGVGALVRHPVPAIAGAVIWVFVVENMVGLLAGPVAAYLPGKLAQVLAGLPQGAGAVSATVAAAVIAGYALVLALAGMLVIRRRDVL